MGWRSGWVWWFDRLLFVEGVKKGCGLEDEFDDDEDDESHEEGCADHGEGSCIVVDEWGGFV